ncbi:MAG: glycosyl hydrolase-related protein, partial [Candidatus Sumerlaeota bacterium]|nr:glycosyl hydrolase-related protein [Candidatus Sumerlaeota bacterium]
MVKQFREIHIVSNTHWDREFRFPFQQTRMLLVQMMDYLLDLLEHDPEYRSYTMDAHCIMIEDYLDVRPENRARIERLVRDRRLFLGPWYTLPDIPNIGQESVVRNLMYGHRVAGSFGHVMKIGYTPCSWGQTGQLPQIFAGFGIDTALFYRGISPHETTSEFIWESPDGTRVLAHRFALFARYNYYYLIFRKVTYGLDINDRDWRWGGSSETPFKNADGTATHSNIEILEPDILYRKENLAPALEKMLEIEGGQYFGPYFLAMHGHDISWPHPLEAQVVKDAASLMPDVKIMHSNLEDYFDTLKSNLDLSKLPILKGERRTNLKEGYWTYLFPGTISARTRLKQENFRTENLLVHQAEPASTIAWMLGQPYPSRYIDLAWRHLISTHTHDANAGCALDEVTEDVRYHLRQSARISEGLMQEGLKFLAKNVDTKDANADTQFLIIFNTLPFERSEMLGLIIDLPEACGAQSLIIRDDRGMVCDYQILSQERGGLFVDNPWNVPHGYLTRRFRVKLKAERIPALGYMVYTVEPNEKPDRRSGSLFAAPNVMENEFLRVEVNPDGTLKVAEKTTGAEYDGLLTLEDAGEVGNAWRRIAPAFDQVIYSTGAEASIKRVEDGPLSATIRIDLSLKVPRECRDDTHRSDDHVELPVTHLVTLTKGSRRVDVVTGFDNAARDHRLRLLFPTRLVHALSSHADSHFDVVERPIALPNRDDWKEPVVGTYPYRTFVDVSDGRRGLALLSEGLQEFEVTRDEACAIAITLVRAVRIKLEVSEQRKQELPDPGTQCPGRHEFRMAIQPHDGNWTEAALPENALRLSVPLRAAQFGKNKRGYLPRALRFITCSNNRAMLSAIKKAEKSDAIVLRLYNPSDDAQTGTIQIAKEIRRAWRVNLNEE